MMPVSRPIADAVQVNFQQATLLGALNDTCSDVGGEYFREKGEYVETHGLHSSLMGDEMQG
jgi:hypothetical protein